MRKNYLLFLTFIFIFLASPLLLQAQPKTESAQADTLAEFTGRDATKAILYSAFIPGGGQFYNKKYVKSGIVLGLETVFLGTGIYYQIKREQAWDDYAQSGDQADYDHYNDYHIKSQSMYWWFFAVKFMSVLDAYVDAKLYNYNEKKRQLELRLETNSVSINYRF